MRDVNQAARLVRAREIAAEVRAWLAVYHCLGGEYFSLGREGSGIVLVMDFAASPMLGYLDEKYPNVVNDLFERMDKMGLYVRRGAVASEINVFEKRRK